MKKSLHNIPGLVKLMRKGRHQYQVIKNYLRLKRSVKTSPLKIVVGSSGVYSQGWLPTDVEYLNLLKPSDWERYFDKHLIDAILAEHVWEHLSLEEGLEAARQCYQYLKPGGYLRIAVPDGNHPKLSYIDHVKVGVDGHKVLYNYQNFSKLFENAGFSVKLLEYFDEEHKFHYNEWGSDKGMIHRSKRFDSRNSDNQLNYTSIIIDAYKEL